MMIFPYLLISKSNKMAAKYVNLHPEVDFLEQELSFIAGNIGSSSMERIARHYMDFTDADLEHCRIDGQMKQSEFHTIILTLYSNYG